MELDLSKPLIDKFHMRRRIWHLDYEGIHLLCFHYRKYRHKDESCSIQKNEVENNEDIGETDADVDDVPFARLEVMEEFGSWMLVQCQRQKLRFAARSDILETENQIGRGDKRDCQANIQGSRLNALANYVEENLGLTDTELAINPIIKAGEIQDNKGDLYRTTRNNRHVIQGKGNVPKG